MGVNNMSPRNNYRRKDDMSADTKIIARAARELAIDLTCIGNVEQDRIASAFEKFAERIDPQGRE